MGRVESPEQTLNVLGDVSARDVLERGCGTAYFSARLARAGANVVGVDISPEQLKTAHSMQREHPTITDIGGL